MHGLVRMGLVIATISAVLGCKVSTGDPDEPEQRVLRGDCMCSVCLNEPFCAVSYFTPGLESPYVVGADRCRELLDAGLTDSVAERVYPVQATSRDPRLERSEYFWNTTPYGYGRQPLWCLRPSGKDFHTIDELDTPGCAEPDSPAREKHQYVDTCEDIPFDCRDAMECGCDPRFEEECPNPFECPDYLVRSGKGADREVCARAYTKFREGEEAAADKLVESCEDVHFNFWSSILEVPEGEEKQPQRFCFLACGGRLPHGDNATGSEQACDVEEFDPPHVPLSAMRIFFEELPGGRVPELQVGAKPRVRQFKSTIAVEGMMALDATAGDGSPCGPGLTCDATVAYLEIHGLEDLKIGSKLNKVTFRAVQAFNANLIPGTIIPHPLERSRSRLHIAANEGRALSSAESGGSIVGGNLEMDHEIVADIDWQEREFTGVILIGSRGGDFVEASLYGRIPSRSPVTDAGPDRTVECASPAGTPVALSAAGSTDPDGFGDIASFVWAARLPDGTERPVPGGGVDVESAAPLGRTVFRVTATDTYGIGDVDSAAVFVEDTTPPRFEKVDVATDCLWEPDHRMHLLRLGEEIIAEVTDRCAGEIRDVRIVGAFSNEPVDGIGDGSTAPDVRFGSAAVCLRSERDGGHPDGRGYTVVLEARDGNGNVERHEVRIDVPHDQRPASRCRTGDLAPVVEDGDPRCEVDVATASTVVAMPAVVRDAGKRGPSEAPAGNGCTASAAGHLDLGMLAVFALCATVLCRRRRIRKAGQGRS